MIPALIMLAGEMTELVQGARLRFYLSIHRSAIPGLRKQAWVRIPLSSPFLFGFFPFGGPFCLSVSSETIIFPALFLFFFLIPVKDPVMFLACYISELWY
jgi:hypothetical protein